MKVEVTHASIVNDMGVVASVARVDDVAFCDVIRINTSVGKTGTNSPTQFGRSWS
jgi:hypothetical protein